MPPSIPACNPAQSWSTPHAICASFRVTAITNLAIKRRNVSPIPIGRIPGHLSNARSRPDINARYAAHGGLSLASQEVNSAIVLRSFSLLVPY